MFDPILQADRVEIVGSPPVSSTPSNFTIITSAADIVLAAPLEVLFIQNLGQNPLFVKRGASASSSSFSYVLAPSSNNDDGTGGSIVISDFIGTISFAGTSVRYMAWKR